MKRFTLASVLLALGWQQLCAQAPLRFTLDGLWGNVWSIDGSFSGRWLAAAAGFEHYDAGLLKVWDLNANALDTRFPDGTVDTATSVRFIPDTELLTVMGPVFPLTVYEYRADSPFLPSWRPLLRYQLFGEQVDVAPNFDAAAVVRVFGDVLLVRGVVVSSLGNYGRGARVAFSPDGALLAVVGARTGSGVVHLWRVSDRTLVGAWQTPDPCSAVGFSVDGQLLIVGDVNGVLRIWDLTTNASTAIQAHTRAISAVRTAPDDSFVATASLDGYVRLWNLPNLSLRGALNTGYAASLVGGGVLSLFISADGQYLYTGGADGKMDRWRTADLQHDRVWTRSWTLHGFRTGTRDLWVDDGTRTLVYDENGNIMGQTSVRGTFSPDKRWVISGNRVVRVSDGQTVLTSADPLQGVFAPNSAFALLYDTRRTTAYRTDTWTPLWQRNAPLNLFHLQFSRDGSRFRENDRVYDTLTGTLLASYPAADLVALSESGLYAATAHTQNQTLVVKLYQVGNPTPLWTWQAPNPYEIDPEVLQFASSERHLLIGWRGFLLCFDTASGILVWDKLVPTNSWAGVKIQPRPNSSQLLIASRRGVELIDLTTGGTALTQFLFDSGGYVVLALEPSADGELLAISTEDSSVHVVQIPIPIGDVDGDGCVSDRDLLLTLFAFGQTDAPADLNADGVVNDADLLLVLFNFGRGC